MFGIQPPNFEEADDKKKSWFQSIYRWFNETSKTANVTTTYTVAADVYWVRANATGGAFTVTLPLAKDNWRRSIGVIKIDSSANAVTIGRSGSDTINGATTQSLASQYSVMEAISDGVSAWDIKCIQ